MKVIFRFLFSLVFLTVPHITFSQAPENEITPEEHIQQLHSGTLLVRLKTKQNAILLLEARGMKEDADLIWQEQRKKNEEIVKAFTFIFDFCPVYFFYDENSGLVKDGQYEGVLMNANFDTLDLDTLHDFNHVYFADIGEVYFEAFSQHMKGAVILDSAMNLLPRRFPSIVRKRAGLALIERTNTTMIEEMNEMLHKFYDRVTH